MSNRLFSRSILRIMLPLAFLGLAQAAASAADAAKDFHAWAPTPPMGWNSWDCFATTVTEAQTKEQTDFMAAKLAQHGWQYIVVDIQWYEPGAKDFGYRKDAKLTMDEVGRLLPAPNRFPSAADGMGFKSLSAYVHAKGLKFGIHLMRGIPRQAVTANLPIKGSSSRAAEVANLKDTCQWNPDMYGVDMSKPGAQEYYDSVFAQIAAWGVDLVKVDDLSRPYHQAEIEGIRKAIDKTGRQIVLSTSPGETPVASGAHVNQNANMWRISDDFWDKWSALREQFKRLHDWTPHRIAGAYPDADMLPLGIIGQGRRTKFTHDEQITMLTLWSIARSPLMHGGDMTKTDDFTLSLLTNDEILAVDQKSVNNRQLFRTADDLIAWVAEVPASQDRYLAVFHAPEAKKDEPARAAVSIPVTLADLGLSGSVTVRDLWQHKDLGTVKDTFIAENVPAHGARMFRLSPTK